MSTALSADQVQQLQKDFEADPHHRVMQNAVTQTRVRRA